MTHLHTASGNQPLQRAIVMDHILWKGVSISISYEADWLGLSASGLDVGNAHLELQVLAPKGAPLPVTDTGYRSEFLECGLVEVAGGLRPFVQGWLDEAARSLSWRVAQAKWEQLDLFG